MIEKLQKKSNLSISLDQQFEVPYSLLLMYVQLPKYIETKVLLAICFFYFIQNVFFKKRGLALVSFPHFQLNFWKNIFSCYILLTGQTLLSEFLYFFRHLAMFIANVCFPSCDVTFTWYLFQWGILNGDITLHMNRAQGDILYFSAVLCFLIQPWRFLNFLNKVGGIF